MMILLYFWTCGGPFGVEPAVQAGGALLTWVCMVIAALCWSLPQAIMAAELSLMMDVNGGNIVWVKRAFGDFVAFVNAQTYLVLNLSTLALLVYFFIQYIPGSSDFSPVVEWVVRSSFVAAVILVNLVGLEWLARLSTIFLVFIFSPFFVEMIGIVIFNVPINFSNLLWIPETSEIDFGTLISTVVWSFGGFDSIGSVAGEVSGKRTFMIGVLGSFPLVLLNYFWPIMLDFIIDRKLSHWDAGYFTLIVFKYFPTWLGVWFTLSSTVSNFAQCASGLAPVAWNVWAMARGEETGVAYLPLFLSWEWQRRPGGTIRPIAGILFTGIAILLISAIDHKILLQVFLLLRICNLLMEYAALIYLKISEPDTPRPFKVPGGVPGAVLLVIPTIAISILSIYYADIAAIRMGGIILGVIICLWPLALLFKAFLEWGKHKKLINV
uniref:Amino acid permease/ SLC12A domain-containing protein n=1 Tax=Arcella intermedia TaxID=1963864 RepID=A0A6B2L457_9EUKA